MTDRPHLRIGLTVRPNSGENHTNPKHERSISPTMDHADETDYGKRVGVPIKQPSDVVQAHTNNNDQESKNKNRKFSVDCLHVLVLAQFAFAQPLLYRLSLKTVYLEDQGIDAISVLLLISFLCLIVPGVLCVLEAGMGLLSDRAREQTHNVIMFFLFSLTAMPVLKLASFIFGLIAIALSLIVALLAVLAYRRWAFARTLISAAAPALIVFPGQFLCFSPASRYLFPRPNIESYRNAANNPVPVLMLLFDEFCGTTLMDRDGQIDASRYPNFAALA